MAAGPSDTDLAGLTVTIGGERVQWEVEAKREGEKETEGGGIERQEERRRWSNSGQLLGG